MGVLLFFFTLCVHTKSYFRIERISIDLNSLAKPSDNVKILKHLFIVYIVLDKNLDEIDIQTLHTIYSDSVKSYIHMMDMDIS